MPVNAYSGTPGSGKTYTVLSSVILEHLAVGRRVVTNLEGLRLGSIRNYLMKKKKIRPENIGELVLVPDSAIGLPKFFPSEYKPTGLEDAHDAMEADDGVAVTVTDSVVQPGDLVIIDEAWKWFEQGSDISEDMLNFFRFHRHYKHPDTDIPCDLIVITQSIIDLDKRLKRLIVHTSVTNKLVEVGMSNQCRVDLYSKTLTNRKPLRTQVITYKSEIYSLYSSSRGGKSSKGSLKEQLIDKRVVIWRNPLFVIFLVAGVVMVIYGFFNTMRGYDKFEDSLSAKPKPLITEPPATVPFMASLPNAPTNSSANTSVSPASTALVPVAPVAPVASVASPVPSPVISATSATSAASPAVVVPVAAAVPAVPVASSLYIAGYYTIAKNKYDVRRYLVLSGDGKTPYLVVDPPELQYIDPLRIQGKHEGKLITTSGGVPVPALSSSASSALFSQPQPPQLSQPQPRPHSQPQPPQSH